MLHPYKFYKFFSGINAVNVQIKTIQGPFWRTQTDINHTSTQTQ